MFQLPPALHRRCREHGWVGLSLHGDMLSQIRKSSALHPCCVPLQVHMVDRRAKSLGHPIPADLTIC